MLLLWALALTGAEEAVVLELAACGWLTDACGWLTDAGFVCQSRRDWDSDQHTLAGMSCREQLEACAESRAACAGDDVQGDAW